MSVQNVAGITPQPVQNPSPVTALPHSSAGLVVGNTLEALVTNIIDSRRVLLEVQGNTMLAESSVTLRAGDRLVVRVEDVEPKILLQVLSAEMSDAEKVGGYLRLQRSQPQSLAHLFANPAEFFQTDDLPSLRQPPMQKLIADILLLVDKLVYTQANLKDALFVRNFVGQLGLLMEADLLKVLSGGDRDDKRKTSLKPEESLKGLLLRLSEQLRSQAIAPASDTSSYSSYKSLFEFLDASVKSIETQQVMNAVGWQSDNTYFLQVPFQCADGIRMQDIYIQVDRDAERRGRGEGNSRIVLLLNLDAVGDMIVDVKLAGKALECRIKCSDELFRDFAAEKVDDFKHRLAETGYDVRTISFVAKPLLAEDKLEFLESLTMYYQNSVNLFA
jgi:hypothetical protein